MSHANRTASLRVGAMISVVSRSWRPVLLSPAMPTTPRPRQRGKKIGKRLRAARGDDQEQAAALLHEQPLAKVPTLTMRSEEAMAWLPSANAAALAVISFEMILEGGAERLDQRLTELLGCQIELLGGAGPLPRGRVRHGGRRR